MIKSGTTNLGQYRLGTELGSGGMGIVYRATDETLHREVAMKVLHPHLLTNEDLKERFRREARMHAQLMHPNVVTLLSIYEDGEHMALIMEMVQGENLRDYLRSGKKHSLADLLHIAQAILSGLQAAHQMGLVHRDLKPANVLLSDNGDIKLMDFGLAKPAAGDDDLTQSGATVGSFRYMSPEQILNQPIDARTDLYAFGILLYQMVTGKLPFDASAQTGGEFEIMEKQVRENPIAPHELNRSLPLEISALILRLLAKNPDDRPSSCIIVKQELYKMNANLSDQMMAPSTTAASPTVVLQSNTTIAKGLIEASAKSAVNLGSSLLASFIAVIPGKITQASCWHSHWPEPWKKAVGWGGSALLLLILGWVLISVVGISERPVVGTPTIATQPPLATVDTSPNNAENLVENPENITKELKENHLHNIENVSDPSDGSTQNTVNLAKTEAQSVTAKKNIQEKTVVKVKRATKHKPAKRSITYSVKHKVTRSVDGKIDVTKPHEFKGGNHLYFKSLRNYRGKEAFTSYKKGQIRLYLDKAVHLEKIILKKASVGKLNFKGGYIKLAVQDDKHKWHQIFFRENDDVDIAVSIGKSKLPKKTKGVRLRFRTPEPITIGPIDLIR
ncbi:MAG: serine/threonine-protein kinase [Mariprofundaceae bacterium]|nr:serine/threonine-protein kinase [Mariprofundaceae bacterium]